MPIRPTPAAALAAALAALAAAAAAEVEGPPPPTEAAARVVAAYEARCAEAEAGALIVAPEAYAPADLDGDGAADDLVMDMAHAACAWNGTLWAGTGGAPVHLIVGDAEASWWGGGWQLVDFDPPAEDGPPPLRVLLLAQHGSACDSFGAAPCVRAVAWGGDGFVTLGAP